MKMEKNVLGVDVIEDSYDVYNAEQFPSGCPSLDQRNKLTKNWTCEQF